MSVLAELGHAIRAGKGAEVDALLNRAFFRYLLTAPSQLRALLSELEEDWYDTYPRHRMTRAIAAASGPMQLVDDAAQRAFDDWVARQARPDTRDILGVQTGRLRAMLATGAFGLAAEHAAHIRATIAEAADTAGFPDVLPSVLLRVGGAHLQIGDLDSASEAFATAYRWANAAGDHPFEPHARGHLALVDALHDDFPAARSWLDGAAEDTAVEDDTYADRLRMVSLQARALVEVGSGAADAAEAALARIQGGDLQASFWWVGAHAHALFERQWGEPRRGIARLEQLLRYHREMCGPTMFPGQLLRADLASLHQTTGDLPEAERVLQAVGLDDAQSAVRVARARQHLLAGRTQDGLTLLRAEHDHTPGGGAPSLLVLRAVAEHLDAGTVPPRVMADASARLRMSDARLAAQEAFGVVRDRILDDAGMPRQTYPVDFPYGALKLTRREQEILRALRRYSSSQDIARHLSVSVNTVKTHKRALYRKLGVHSRAQALIASGAIPSSEGEEG